VTWNQATVGLNVGLDPKTCRNISRHRRLGLLCRQGLAGLAFLDGFFSVGFLFLTKRQQLVL